MDFNEPTRGTAAITKAYELRERVSEREKLYIESHYYDMVTGEADKAIETYQLWQKTYPRDLISYANLGVVYGNLGQHDKAVREEIEALRVGRNNGPSYFTLVNAYLNQSQFDKANETLSEITARKLDNAYFIGLRYQLAFARNNEAEMERQVAAAVVEPGTEGWLLALQGDTEAYHGRLAKAREYTRRAVASARHNGGEESALAYAMVGALREAEFGNRQLAKKQAEATIMHNPGQQVLFLGALALARAGVHHKALAVVRELNRRFPKDTLLSEYWLPSIRAAVELDRGASHQAIEYLEPTRRYELAAPQLPTNVLLYPIYLRGEAFLAAGLPYKAQSEFQKILDHPGLIGNYLLGPLAHLGLGRAYAMEAGIPIVSIPATSIAQPHISEACDRPEALAKARLAYEKFFALWKDADPDLPVLKQTKAERAKLQ